jgi:hypothetical protein
MAFAVASLYTCIRMGSGGDRLKVGTNRPVVNGRGLHWQLHMTSISDI